MPSDDERRAVARRLRRSRSEWSGMGWRLWLGPKFCAVVLSDGNRDELEDAAHRLADFIEPSCDRDALLALAEDVEEAAAMAVVMDASKGARMLADLLLDIARRIREACGEVVG